MPFFRRAAVAVGLALGITVTALPAQEASAASIGEEAASIALAQRGDPYSYGAAGPGAFDCSGLTSYAWKKAGVDIPRTSRAQSTFGKPVSKGNLRPGDLVFFYSPVSHAAMYIGNGKIVHASTSGQPVKVVELKYMSGYAGARRPA